MVGPSNLGDDSLPGKKKKHVVSKRDAVRMLKQQVKDVEMEITKLRMKQQGLEKAINILMGEGP